MLHVAAHVAHQFILSGSTDFQTNFTLQLGHFGNWRTLALGKTELIRTKV